MMLCIAHALKLCACVDNIDRLVCPCMIRFPFMCLANKVYIFNVLHAIWKSSGKKNGNVISRDPLIPAYRHKAHGGRVLCNSSRWSFVLHFKAFYICGNGAECILIFQKSICYEKVPFVQLVELHGGHKQDTSCDFHCYVLFCSTRLSLLSLHYGALKKKKSFLSMDFFSFQTALVMWEWVRFPPLRVLITNSGQFSHHHSLCHSILIQSALTSGKLSRHHLSDSSEPGATGEAHL